MYLFSCLVFNSLILCIMQNRIHMSAQRERLSEIFPTGPQRQSAQYIVFKASLHSKGGTETKSEAA